MFPLLSGKHAHQLQQLLRHPNLTCRSIDVRLEARTQLALYDRDTSAQALGLLSCA